MNLHQQVRKYAARTARISPLWPRLRKIKGRDSLDDIVDRATLIVTSESLPPMLGNVPELWPFFDHSPTDGRTLLLVHRALDAARKRFLKETSISGGAPPDPKALKFDTEAEENLRRHTEAGEALTMEPSRTLERDQAEAAELNALEQRARVEAEEVVQLRAAINAAPWARKLCLKKYASQRRALNLILASPLMRGYEIAAKCRLSESTISKLRARVEELADQILTILSEEGEASTPEAAGVSDVHDAAAEQIAAELEHSFAPETSSTTELQQRSAALDLAALFHAPDVDTDVLDSAMLGYSKRRDLSWLARGQRWSGGPKMFREVELVTGSRYGGWADDPARIAQRGRQHAAKFSDPEMRDLREKADAAGVALHSLMSAIDAFEAKRSTDLALASVIGDLARAK